MKSPIRRSRMYEYRKGGTLPPDACGIYQIRNANRAIMYTGTADHLNERMRELVRWGSFLVDSGECFQYQMAKNDAEYDHMRELVRAWIQKNNPPRNSRGRARPPMF